MTKEAALSRWESILQTFEKRFLGVNKHSNDWASIVVGAHELSHLAVVERSRDFRLDLTVDALAKKVTPGAPLPMMPKAIDVTDETDDAIVHRVLGEELT